MANGRLRVITRAGMARTMGLTLRNLTPAQLTPVLRELDGDDVDAIVQVGTNLSMVRLAAAAELWLGKPVIAINTATWWHALRANDIHDKFDGFGRLMAEF